MSFVHVLLSFVVGLPIFCNGQPPESNTTNHIQPDLGRSRSMSAGIEELVGIFVAVAAC